MVSNIMEILKKAAHLLPTLKAIYIYENFAERFVFH